MAEAYICDYIRTPIGRFGGSLSSVRADDLGAIPLRALVERNPGIDWQGIDDVIYGCANQAGEDNRNVALALLLATATGHSRLDQSSLRLGHGHVTIIRAPSSGEASGICRRRRSMSRAPSSCQG